MRPIDELVERLVAELPTERDGIEHDLEALFNNHHVAMSRDALEGALVVLVGAIEFANTFRSRHADRIVRARLGAVIDSMVFVSSVIAARLKEFPS